MTAKLTIPTDRPRDEPLIIIGVNEQWVSLLYGMVTGLLDPEQWDTDAPDDVIEMVRELLDIMNCNVTGINVTATGKIEITFGAGEPVESVDTFVTNPATNPDGTWSYYAGDTLVTINPPGEPNNVWIVPSEPTTDQYCFAARWLAREWSDQLKDILEFIDVAETSLAESAELVGVIPVVGTSIEAIVEYVHEGLLQTVLDWCIGNAMDIDALAVAAEAIYCALQRSNPPYETFWDEIDFPPSLPEIVWSTITSPAEWQNVKDILDWAYGQASGEFMGWVTLRYMQVIQLIGSDLLGLAEPLTNMIAGAMNRSALYDVEDCSTFDCVGICEWLGGFGQGDWTPYTGRGEWYETGDYFRKIQSTQDGAVQPEWVVPAGCTVIRVIADVWLNFGNSSAQRTQSIGTDVQGFLFSTTRNADSTFTMDTGTVSIPAGERIIVRGAFSTVSTPSEGRITRLVIYYTGTTPSDCP